MGTNMATIRIFTTKLWNTYHQPVKNFVGSKKALPIIALFGLILFLIIVKSAPPTIHDIAIRASVHANYIELKETLIAPEIIGFGTVEPDLKIQSKAEVAGRVVYVHSDLKKGEILKRNTLLLKIDDKDYLLQLKQAEADLLVKKANLEEMQLNIQNNELELKLANEKFQVRKKEFARIEKLRKTGAVSQSNLEAEKQNLLRQKQEVQQLKNKQTTLPSALEVMRAQLAIAKANIQKAQRDLDRTDVTLPFDARINYVYTQQEQYLLKNAPLFNASGLDKIIVNAQFPIEQFAAFVAQLEPEISPDINEKQLKTMSAILNSLSLSAIVEEAGGHFKSWQAKVERFSDDLDPKSRTVGVIISVNDSYKQIEPGIRPPLLEGMYMKVRLLGKKTNRLVVPKFALHEGNLFIIDDNNKLEKIVVDGGQYQGDLLLIRPSNSQNASLKAGDKAITSDLFPVVSGMSVIPILDQAVLEQMEQQIGTQQ